MTKKLNLRASLALWLLIAPCAIPGAAQASESSSKAVRGPVFGDFVSPPRTARPDVRWWWPGDAVEDAELERQIAALDAAGFGGAEIQSFNPGIPNITASERGAVNGYATPTFFAHVRAAAAAAARRGMKLDYTLGSAWPSGGGKAITPELALLELTMAMTSAKGGSSNIAVTMPQRTKRFGAFPGFDSWTRSDEGKQWRERFEAQARIVSIVAYKGRIPSLVTAPKSPLQLSAWSDVREAGALVLSSRIDLTQKLRADGTLDWTVPQGDWVVLAFKQYASNSSVLGASGLGPQFVLDHFDKTAFDAHVARVGTPLTEALGSDPEGLRGTFVDSLELFQDLPWSDDFLTQFKRRRGYDLSPYLPLVLQPGWMQAWNAHFSPAYFEASGDPYLAGRVRADYRQTVSDLLLDNFLRPFAAWNHSHGLTSKFQAHGGPIDALLGYGLTDVPETEDLHEGGNPYFMRLARSAADIYGRNIVSAESLVWPGRPYSVTPDEMRKRIDVLAASGVNAQTIHGFTYRFHDDKWPGWFVFEPSSFGAGFSSMLQESNPIWAAMPRLTSYTTRLNTVLRQGTSVVPVALYLGDVGYYEGMDGKGHTEADRLKRLVSSGFDFDRINPDGLSRSKVVKRKLITPGGHAYSALVFPDVASLRAETAERVAAFAKAGLPILFTQVMPSRETGLLDHTARDLRVGNAITRVAAAGGKVVPEADLPDALRAARVSANLVFAGSAEDVVFVDRKIGTTHAYFIVNHATEVRDASFIAPVKGGVERWDAMEGNRSAIPARLLPDGTEVPLRLEPGESALIIVDPAQSAPKTSAAKASSAMTLPADGWTLAVEGHVLQGKPYRADMGPVSLGLWSQMAPLAAFSGTGSYRRTIKVGYDWLGNSRKVTLMLAGVHDMATVAINGQSFPPVISAPWTVDITSALRPGDNELLIMVANVPQNAMLSSKTGYATLKPVPSGLEGPVQLVSEVSR